MKKNINEFSKPLKIFFDYFPEFKTKKYVIKKINNGFTNYTYLITIDNEKYQIRIANNNKIVSRQNELNVLKNINNDLYVYYDLETGNSIKKWINGSTLKNKVITKKIINLVNSEINKLHNIPIKEDIIRHNNYFFIDSIKNKVNLKYLDLFEKIINEIDYSKLVISHNDLSLNNIILNQEYVYFIDFEWTRLNHHYWDFANFIRESNLSLNKIKYWCLINPTLEFKLLIKFIYLCCCYALQWTYATNQSKKIHKYRNKTLKKMNKYYELINEIDNEK